MIRVIAEMNIKKPLRIAVLFDGAGLARLGLEQAGHICTGFEIDPFKHRLSKLVGSGNCIQCDATTVDLSGFDAAWCSPPCQWNSAARTEGNPVSKYSDCYLDWCLQLPIPILWVENTFKQGKPPTWGRVFNACQFLEDPIQNRNRMIGGRYKTPTVYRPYEQYFPGICPTITATEWKGGGTDGRRASRFYGRRLTLKECAYHMGFEIPDTWYKIPEETKFTPKTWERILYEAIGNGVPVYMAKAFGDAYTV
jgi:site-specific DNA-cytosine methylase